MAKTDVVVHFSSITIEVDEGLVERYRECEDNAIAEVVEADTKKLAGDMPNIEDIEEL